MSEAEVESLAGKKEGCDDDVEFITVQRPDSAAKVRISVTSRARRPDYPIKHTVPHKAVNRPMCTVSVS